MTAAVTAGGILLPERVFKMASVELEDIDPKMTPEQIMELYTPAYPFLAGATIEGPDMVGDRLVYRFVEAAPKTKG